MGNEPKEPTEPKEPIPPTEPKEPEPKEPEPKEPEGDEGLLDEHGKPAINAEKYKRDMEKKDAKIAELEAKIAEQSKTEEGRKELQKQIDEMKAEQADERVTHKLEMSGCLNTKAAKALLGDYDNDVEKLKEECPYLFQQDDGKPTGSTGVKPTPTPRKTREEIRAIKDPKERRRAIAENIDLYE